MSSQPYLDSVQRKTGKTVDEFRVLAEEKGLLGPDVKAGQVVAWLKEDFGLGQGHAMAVYGAIRSVGQPKSTIQEQVAKQFSGARARWREIFDALVADVEKFGSDVALVPRNSYIGVVRDGKKFAIVQPSSERLDVGIKLRGLNRLVGSLRQGAGTRWSLIVCASTIPSKLMRSSSAG